MPSEQPGPDSWERNLWSVADALRHGTEALHQGKIPLAKKWFRHALALNHRGEREIPRDAPSSYIRGVLAQMEAMDVLKDVLVDQNNYDLSLLEPGGGSGTGE